MARHESFRAMPTQPIPYGPKQQPQPARKDVVAVNQSVSGDCHTCGQVKREIHQQISTAPLAPQPKSAAIPIPGISMPMAFQQQPIPIQFGAPGPQQMPVTLPIGNAPQIPQQMFVHNLQSHPLQPQAMIHHGQSMAFGPQINHQLGPQLGNLGIGIAPPLFSQQQTPGKFAGPRKTPAVKITHPETHEVLKLDKTMDSFADGGSLGQRPHNNAIPQSQPMASFAPTHYFTQLPPNSYNRPPIFFPTSTSVTPGSQPPWFSYPGGQAISFLNPPPLATASSGPIHGSVKLTAVQVGPKVGSSVPIRMPANKVELKSARPPVKAPVVHQQKSNDACVTDKSEACVTVVHKDGPTASVASGPKEKVPSESVKAKPVTGKKKKKRERLSKADAAGTSDLYNAYKGPEEKLQHANPSESVDSSHVVDSKIVNADNHETVVVTVQEDGQSKAEVDDWEDAADISTPKLENGKQVNGDGTEATGPKKYTRDFLLTFSEECTDLPVNFEIGSDIADALMSVPTGNCRVGDRDPYPSPGRSDRSPGISRGDRRGMNMMDDDKWTKAPGALITAPGSVGQNFRPGQGVNYGVLKNPRGQPLNQFYPIFPGPMQSMMPQGGPVHNNSDADRWRSLNNSRGLMPSPQAPLQVMHKAEKKYEVGKVSDEEQAKQRQLKGILNKLTPQNFDKLFQQVRDVNIDNTTTLSGVIAQIFDKALMEPTFCEMYANFCFHLSGVLPDFTENDEKITFKRLLLNKCQEEFERGEREQAEADRVEEEGGIKQSEEEREEKRIKARRRMLGNIRLIGELYKKKMLTERIMHECIQKLLGQHENPDEENLEALCKLMSTIGDQIDHAMAKGYMDVYFDGMMKLTANQKLSSRVRFMLRDLIDLRKNRWQQRRKVEGPKKIEEVHRDAAQERQTQASRLTRGPSMNSNSRRGPPGDYGPRRSSVLPSPNSQSGGLRGLPSQARGYGMHDVRLDDPHPLENRTLSLPLTQRPLDDGSITLGPQGGLARVMSIRGQPSLSSVPLTEISLGIADSRRMMSGPNGYNATNDKMPYRSRGDVNLGNMPDRLSETSSDQPIFQDRNVSVGNQESRIADLSYDRFSPTTFPAGRALGSLGGNLSVASDAKPLSEETLREKSISTIREFYSVKDEGEVALCIRELNSPSFYPSIVSLWVTDSFERKDMERELLATLLVNLTRSPDNLFNQLQLTQGFESVLASLEDAVNDAPRAAEFLGRILVKVILENVVPLREIGKLIHEGGEESGSLLESGLASEVLGSILEIIEMEKGDSILKEMISSSKLRLEDFKPPHPIKSKKLDAFM